MVYADIMKLDNGKKKKKRIDGGETLG